MSTETTTIETESQWARDFNWETQRIWKVINPNKVNRHGTNTAYKLVPGAAIPPLLDSSSPVYQRASVVGHTVWVTASSDTPPASAEWMVRKMQEIFPKGVTNLVCGDRENGLVERAPDHGRVVTGGKQAGERGYFYEPTVICDVRQSDELITWLNPKLNSQEMKTSCPTPHQCGTRRRAAQCQLGGARPPPSLDQIHGLSAETRRRMQAGYRRAS
jgi:Copper amine oxidase, enzyme domain